MNFFKKVGRKLKHYADPRTHIKGVRSFARHSVDAHRSAFHYIAEQHGRAFDFLKRQARKDYVFLSKATSAVVQVVTPVLAFVASLVPVFGLVLGPVIAGLGALIARFSTSVALRAEGIRGLHNRQLARGKMRRTFKYGLFGSALGGIASAFGLSLGAGSAAADAAAVTGTSTAQMAGETSAAAAFNSAQVGQDAASLALDEVIAAGQPAFVEASKAAAGAVESAAPIAPQFADVAPAGVSAVDFTKAGELAASGLGTTAGAGGGVTLGASARAAASAGVSAGGGLWGFIKGAASTVWDAGKALGPLALKMFGPRGGGAQIGAGAGGVGGGEGIADAGGEGLLDSVSGLPLWLKLAAGGVGAGALYLGLRRKKEKAS